MTTFDRVFGRGGTPGHLAAVTFAIAFAALAHGFRKRVPPPDGLVQELHAHEPVAAPRQVMKVS